MLHCSVATKASLIGTGYIVASFTSATVISEDYLMLIFPQISSPIYSKVLQVLNRTLVIQANRFRY